MLAASDEDRLSAGRWASPSTATPSPRSRRSSTSPSCRATSASPAPGCSRCAATPTCRATAPWASGSGPPEHFLDAAARRVRLRAAARARLRHRRRGPGAARRRGQGLLRDGRQLRLRDVRHRRSPRTRCGSADLTVHVSTKLNRSHVVHGREALILPALGRSEKDLHRRPRRSGSPSRTRCRAVHASQGPLEPASTHLRSEVDIVCSLAAGHPRRPATASRGACSATTTPRSAAGSPGWCPGCAAYDEKVDQPGGFVLPHPPRDTRDLPDRRRARRSSRSARSRCCDVPEGRLLLQTMRSHDQFNTTIYGLDDRYRGIKNGRRVVFVHPDDIARARAGATATIVDLVSEWEDGSERTRHRASGSSPTTTPRGCAGGLLPGDQPAGAAGLQGRGQQHPDVQVGGRPARSPPADGTGVIERRPRATRRGRPAARRTRGPRAAAPACR